jgi:signal peptidase I
MSTSSPRHGDIVIIRDPDPSSDAPVYLVKRVIGLPGDQVEISDGQLYLNGERLSETYVSVDRTEGIFPPLTVDKGKLFVLGDNRLPRASRDSRSFGLVDVDDVRGRAEFLLWPAGRMAKL